MVSKVFRSFLPGVTAQLLWDFHSDVNALHILTPPGTKVKILSETTAVVEGALHELEVKKFGTKLRWNARIHRVDAPTTFTDTAEKSPFKTWSHVHAFSEENGGCWLTDSVSYSMPFGFLGQIVSKILIDRDVESIFAFRHKVTKAHFKVED